MAEPEKLTINDAENAQKGILSLVLAYPNYPKGFKADNQTVKWNSINQDKSIGLYPMQGAVYLKKYISGSYIAQMPFQMVFRSSPTTNKDSINSQSVLEGLAGWMEKDTH